MSNLLISSNAIWQNTKKDNPVKRLVSNFKLKLNQSIDWFFIYLFIFYLGVTFMQISRNDRIGIVGSVVALVISIPCFFDGKTSIISLVLILAVIIFWGIKFIRNDISFLKIKE